MKLHAELERQRLLRIVNRKPSRVWTWLRDRWLWLKWLSWN